MRNNKKFEKKFRRFNVLHKYIIFFKNNDISKILNHFNSLKIINCVLYIVLFISYFCNNILSHVMYNIYLYRK